MVRYKKHIPCIWFCWLSRGFADSDFADSDFADSDFADTHAPPRGKVKYDILRIAQGNPSLPSLPGTLGDGRQRTYAHMLLVR